MIEKLDESKPYSTSPHEIIQKLNELIDSYNEFRTQMYPLVAVIEDDFTVTWTVDDEYKKKNTT